MELRFVTKRKKKKKTKPNLYLGRFLRKARVTRPASWSFWGVVLVKHPVKFRTQALIVWESDGNKRTSQIRKLFSCASAERVAVLSGRGI